MRQGAWGEVAVALLLGCAVSVLADDPSAKPFTAASIDHALSAEHERLGLEPTGLATPGAFARRLALDAWGRLPDEARAAEARADAPGEARSVWVRQALDDPRFVTHAAERLAQAWWPASPGDDANAQLLRGEFQHWLESRLRAGARMDALAAEVLGGEGTTDESPALGFLVKFGATGAADAAGPVARRFLGLSWDCARCHDHPFGEATQADFHALAAFFGRLRVRGVPRRQLVFRVGEAPLGEHRAALISGHAEVRPQFPAAPKLDGGASPQRANETSRRARLARWLTDRRNPYFARAQANRVWRDLFGRALVEPFDELDLAPDDAKAHLLGEVAEGFAQSGYSLRWLYRTLLSSDAYARALSSGPEAHELGRAVAAARPRPLPREARAHMLLRVVGRDRPAPGEFVRLRERLLERVRAFFPEEGEGLALLPSQALVQLSDPGLLSLLQQAHSHYPEGARERLQAIYWTALGRGPSQAERAVLLPALKRGRLEDVLWAVVSSSEFGSNH